MTARRDDYGLGAAWTDRLLPVLVAAMSFLAALALAGTLASAQLATAWQAQASATLTIQVPQPDDPDASGKAARLQAVLAALRKMPDVADPQVVGAAAQNALLAPWLGETVAQLGLALPGAITARWTGPGAPDALIPALDAVSPGTLVDAGAVWARRVAALTGSLQACALAVLAIVALIAAAVVALAARAGLALQRETIAILHGLGALDGDIAGRFALRVTRLVASGAVLGLALALPVLAWLAMLAAPFSGAAPGSAFLGLPAPLWIALPALPVSAAAIGWATAQLTVRGWLRGLP